MNFVASFECKTLITVTLKCTNHEGVCYALIWNISITSKHNSEGLNADFWPVNRLKVKI